MLTHGIPPGFGGGVHLFITRGLVDMEEQNKIETTFFR